MSRESLKKNYEKAAQDYANALIEQWELSADYCFWVSDEIGETFCFGDISAINMDDLRYAVDNDITFEEFYRHEEYVVRALSLGVDVPNFKNWCKGCPRLSDEKLSELEELRKKVEQACEDAKKSLF